MTFRYVNRDSNADGTSRSPDGDDSATSRRDGDSQKRSKAGRARGKPGEIPAKCQLSGGSI